MSLLKAILAVDSLRWAGILGVTAGIHVVAFCIYVEGGGEGPGRSIPEGRVTLRLTQAEDICIPAIAPFTSMQRPDKAREEPVQVEWALSAPGQLPTVPPQATCPVPPTTQCSLPAAAPTEVRSSAPSRRTSPLRRVAGASASELDRPLNLGDGDISEVAVPQPRHCNGTPKSHGAPASAKSRNPGRTIGSAEASEGIEPDFALEGRPVYPISCRRGDCSGYRPCEGVSRWRITVAAPNATPSRIERLQSAGCSKLDDSVESFLRDARVPRAGVFLLRFKFKLRGN